VPDLTINSTFAESFDSARLSSTRANCDRLDRLRRWPVTNYRRLNDGRLSGAVLGKNIWGPGPSSFGRQQRLSEITIEPITSTIAELLYCIQMSSINLGGLCPLPGHRTATADCYQHRKTENRFTVLMLNNVQPATIFGTTIADGYAKLLLKYWPTTTYVYIYGKNLWEFGGRPSVPSPFGCTPDVRPAVMQSTAFFVFFTVCCTTRQCKMRSCYRICCLSVSLSVTLVDHDHIGWKSWKLIARKDRGKVTMEGL